MATFDEIFEKDQLDQKKSLKRMLESIESRPVCHMTTEYTMRDRHLEFAESETLRNGEDGDGDEDEDEDEDALGHIKECDLCKKFFDKSRKDYLQVPRPDCLTDEELAIIRATGHTPEAKSHHFCYRCHIHTKIQKHKHLEDPPGPECLTKDDLHQIHNTGEIPQNKKAHVEKCVRCEG